MITLMRYSLILIMLLSLVGFTKCSRDQGIVLPEIEECMVLTSSVVCIDKEMSNDRINQIVNIIQSNDSIPDNDQLDLIKYFDYNREKIIKEREFEISFAYLGYFRGNFLTNPTDRFELEKSVDKYLKELEKYRRKCGELQAGQMVCD